MTKYVTSSGDSCSRTGGWNRRLVVSRWMSVTRDLRGLSGTAASSSATAAWSEVASTGLTARTTLFKPATATLVHATTSTGVAISTIGVCLGAARLNVDGLITNLVRVSSRCGLIACCVGVFNESTVLKSVSQSTDQII
jgi:hypothetical protein